MARNYCIRFFKDSLDADTGHYLVIGEGGRDAFDPIEPRDRWTGTLKEARALIAGILPLALAKHPECSFVPRLWNN